VSPWQDNLAGNAPCTICVIVQDEIDLITAGAGSENGTNNARYVANSLLNKVL
jgi:hypothetical protein